MSQEKFSVQAMLQSGLMLQQQGRLDEAAKVYQDVLRLDGNNFDALHLSGVIAYQTGRYDQAIDLISRAIKTNPTIPFAYNNLGNALIVLKRFDEALASYRKAAELNPRDADTHFNVGMALDELGRFDEALISYKKAIALRPDFAGAYFRHGNILKALKRFDEALASYDKAIQFEPNHAEVWSNRGNTLSSLGRLDEAVASYGRAIAFKPGLAESHNNLGTGLHDLKRFDEAVASFDQAIQLKPDYAEAFYNRGLTLKAVKRFREAIASFNRATEINPDYALAFINKSFVELLIADFADGWRNFEWRNQREIGGGIPRLKSLDEAVGKTVLVHWEQGLGDTIQFCRYARALKQRGVRVLLAPQANLKALLTSLDREIDLVDAVDPALAFDYHIPLLSLPGLFGTGMETIPAQKSYLSAEPALIEHWKKKIGKNGFKIGICWKGNPLHKDDIFRSFSVDFFQKLRKFSNVRLISLLKNESRLPDGIEALEGLDTGPDAFVDTAAVMMNLDLVITSDTSIAHLAGALGMPTWVALKYVAEWRWQAERSDSPWYPTMRLFRQKADGDWTSVFAELESALAELTNRQPG